MDIKIAKFLDTLFFLMPTHLKWALSVNEEQRLCCSRVFRTLVTFHVSYVYVLSYKTNILCEHAAIFDHIPVFKI